MVKTIVSMIIVAIILTGGALYESNFIKRQFVEFDSLLEVLYEKVENETAIEEDVLSVQKNWLEKKKYLHVFIPHTEIKEVDLWLSESVTLVQNKKWEDALSKVEVLRELAEQIPKTFTLKIENVL
ncbi:MAG: DUF4363 family protein [Clostridia bacterium]|nr:DUF4363 family protein [Clostridia bacterium]